MGVLLIIYPAAVWGPLRSPNYNNNNNFSALGSGGSVNNYNANNCGGLLAGFYVNTRSNGVAKAKDDRRKRRGTSLGSQSLKLPSDVLARTLLAWREIVPALVSCVKATQI